jgi:hypothetical protein
MHTMVAALPCLLAALLLVLPCCAAAFPCCLALLAFCGLFASCHMMLALPGLVLIIKQQE